MHTVVLSAYLLIKRTMKIIKCLTLFLFVFLSLGLFLTQEVDAQSCWTDHNLCYSEVGCSPGSPCGANSCSRDGSGYGHVSSPSYCSYCGGPAGQNNCVWYDYHNDIPGCNASSCSHSSNNPPTPTPCPNLSAPTGVSASCNNNLRYTLSWNAVPGAAYYSVRCDNVGDPWSCSNPDDYCIENVSGTSWSFTGQQGARYGCWVHGRTGCGDFGPASGGPERTCSQPSAPSNLSQSCQSSTSSRFSWSSVSGASRYILRINKSPAGDWMGSGDQWICVNGTSTIRSVVANSPYADWSVSVIKL